MKIILQSYKSEERNYHLDIYTVAPTTVKSAFNDYMEALNLATERNGGTPLKGLKLEIKIKDEEVESKVIKKVIQTILNYDTITELSLRNGYVDAKRLQSIKDSIIEETTLTRLDLSDNLLCDDGIEPVIEILSKNPHIRECDLTNNYISNKGATKLANFLKDNKTLEYLDLSANNISDPAILNNNLKEIDLTGNHIENINDYLPNKSKSSVDLSWNPISSISQNVAKHYVDKQITLDLRDTLATKLDFSISGSEEYILLGTEVIVE